MLIRVLPLKKNSIVYSRNRLEHLNKMAAVACVSFLTLVFTLTFGPNHLPTVAASVLPSRYGNIVNNPGFKSETSFTSADSLHRHHRVLQFTNTKDYDTQSESSNSPQEDTSAIRAGDKSLESLRNSNILESQHSNLVTENKDSQMTDLDAENLPESNNVLRYEISNIPLDLIDNSDTEITTLGDDKFGSINIEPPSSDGTKQSVFRTSKQSDALKAATLEHNLTSYGDRKPVKPNRNALYRNTSEIPEQRLPTAIIIGVKKSGTRALLEFLRIHPDIEGPGPEPHFFDRNYGKGLDWYRSLMPKTYKGQITVEKTPSYFITKEAPTRIQAMNPDIKLILVVRDPVTRAISDYCQAASKRTLPSFEEMAIRDPRRGSVNASWGAVRIGVYAKHMEKWLQTFPRKQIHLVDGQKLITEPAKELAKVEQFLNLPSFITDKHFYLNHFKGSFPCLFRKGRVHCLDERTKGRDHPKVKDSVLRKLKDFYHPYNAKFYEMVNKDFGWST